MAAYDRSKINSQEFLFLGIFLYFCEELIVDVKQGKKLIEYRLQIITWFFKVLATYYLSVY